MQLLLRLSMLALVALAVSGTEDQQDRRRLLFSTRNRPNILSRRFTPESSDTTTTPSLEEKTTTARSRVRLPSRRPSPRFGIRPTSPLKTKIEQQRAEKEEKDKTEIEVISEPPPSQEIVAFTTDKASPKGEQENKPEPEILTKPIPGQEFVAFQAPRPLAQDSIITDEDGEVVYVSLDKSPEETALETKTEDLGLPEDFPLPDAQKVAELDAILITPEEILPIEEIAPATELAADYYVDVTEKYLAAHPPQEQEVPIVTPSPLKNATALEPEVETLISVVTSHPMKEVEGESMHVKHHMEFEHSHIGPENETFLDEPIAHAEPTPELPISEAEVDIVPVTEYLIETDNTADNVSINELPIQDNVTVREVHVLLAAPSKGPVPTQETKIDVETKITSQETITEEPFDTTELPLVAEGEVSNIEILSAASKDQQNLPVNDLYGKYFDESDLDFGKGANNEDKLLFPAETEQKVRSKIEIKEVNGQLYEYEYIYYYDDEYPLYDYEDGAPVDVEPSTSPATTTTSSTTTSTTTTTTTTTPRPTTTPKPTTPKPTTTTTARPSRSNFRGSSRTRGRRPVVNDQEVNVIEEPARGFGRSRGGQSQSIRTSSRTRNNFRTRENEVNSLDNTVHGVTVEENKLPAQTRFPPRSTTPTPTPSRSREREPLFKETSRAGLDEQKEIPLIPGVTGSHSPQGRQSSRGSRRFNAETPAPDTETESDILAQEELTTEVIPTSTVSPGSLSVANLYAFSRAFDAEEMGDATTEIPQAYDYDTEIPLEYQDLYYDYEETATEFPSYLPEVGTEIPEPQTEPEPSAEPEPEPEPEPSTEEPTTSTTTSTTTTATTTTTPAPTTTTTEAARGRGRFSSRNRGASRFSTRRSQAKSSPSTTEEPDTVSEAPSIGNRFRPSRFGSTRHRASNNRFRANAGNNGANEPNSENTVDDTSATVGQTETTTRSSLGHRTRFNRPRISSFRTQQSAKTENEVTKPTPTETPAARNRPRLPSRPGLLRNRFRGRGTTAAEEVSTEPTEDVAAEAPVEEAVIEEVEGEVEISTESSTSPSTTAAPANKRTRGRTPLTRHRFGSRGSPRNPQQSTAADTEEENTNNADETPAVQTQRVPPRTRGRLTRPLASRLSSRLNPRHRGSALAAKTESEVEVTQIDELPTEFQAQEEQPQGDLTEQEVSVDIPEETTQDAQSSSQQSSTRGGTSGGRNILGRFRNRNQAVVSTTPKPPKIRGEPVSNQRRSGLSSLFNRRRRVRPGSVATETPHTQESEIPIDESHTSDSTLAPDTQHAEGEPEPTLEEAVPTSDAFLEVAEDVPVEEPTAEEGPKEEKPTRRFSFFNRRRNRN